MNVDANDQSTEVPTFRDEANAIVAHAFRNGPIEDLHAGKQSELLKDSSLSRLTDDEMKEIMIFACQKVAKLLVMREKCIDEYIDFVMFSKRTFCSQWER